jgi:hypothetical protein
MKQALQFCSILLGFFLSVNYSNAQVRGGNYAGSDGVPRDIQFRDNNGKIIPIGGSDIAGSPLLNEYPGKVQVTLLNDLTVEYAQGNYSLYDDKLFIVKEGDYYPVNTAVKKFTIQYPEIAKTKPIYVFQAGYPKNGDHHEGTFYEVLAANKTVQALKWMHKKVRQTEGYGGSGEKKLVDVMDYYLYDIANKKIILIGNKLNTNQIKSGLISINNSYESTLQSKNIKSESDLISLINEQP